MKNEKEERAIKMPAGNERHNGGGKCRFER
jgi:hypothetical protein